MNKFALHPNWLAAELSQPPSLNKGELHLWCLPLQINKHQEQQAQQWMSEAQREKYNRRHTPSLKHQYVAGRYYLLSLLAAYSGKQPHDIQLSYTRLNKPYLKDNSANIHFNFTDTATDNQGTALLAFSREGAVGVDIESLSRRGNFKTIIEKRFSAKEQAWVTRDNGDIDPSLFLHLWTRKEASGKATGEGINFKMNQRELIRESSSNQPQSTLPFMDERQQKWYLTQLRLNQSLIACVVTAGHEKLDIKAFNRLL